MEYYWKDRPHACGSATTPTSNNACDKKPAGNDRDESDDDLDLEYEQYRRSIASDGVEEGWSAELRCYLSDMPNNATKDMDLVKYWQVCVYLSYILPFITECEQ
jgi:hypothetical protein